MTRPVGSDRTEAAFDRRPRLHPNLVDAGGGPTREQARAVAERKQLVEVRLGNLPGQPFEHLLDELEFGNDVEGYSDNDAKCTERDHCSGEIAVGAIESNERTIRADASGARDSSLPPSK